MAASSLVRARPLASILLVAALLLAAAPAHADPRSEAMATTLRTERIYVSRSLDRAVGAEGLTNLKAAADLYGDDVPLYLAILPVLSEEEGAQTLRRWPPLLRDRVDRDGLYVVADQYGSVSAGAYGVRTKEPTERIDRIVFDDRPNADPADALAYALDVLRTGERNAKPDPYADETRSTGRVLGTVGFGALVFLLVGGRIGRPWWQRRRGRAVAQAGPSLDGVYLEEQARGLLQKLSRRIAATADPPKAALDAYAAASKILDERKPRPIDLLGAFVLAGRGMDALKGRERPPCFFDPRHGAGVRTTSWTGADRQAEIPACTRCAKAIRRGKQPQAATDRGRPYYQRDTVWARTGFGALDDDLTQRIMRGED